jgi:hypothetical protein
MCRDEAVNQLRMWLTEWLRSSLTPSSRRLQVPVSPLQYFQTTLCQCLILILMPTIPVYYIRIGIHAKRDL